MAEDERDRRDRLTALRDRLEAAISTCEPRELAPLAKQYRDTLLELDTMPAKEASRVDDLASRRAARRATAAGQ